MNSNDGILIGSFLIKSGEMVVSDPCYKKGAFWKAANGVWFAYAKKKEGTKIVKEFYVQHEDFSDVNCTESVGFTDISSGVFGFFDQDEYRNNDSPDVLSLNKRDLIRPDDPWYSLCCLKTSSNCGEQSVGGLCAGVISFGAVAPFGDGVYKYFVKRNEAGECVAARVVFDE